MEKSFLQVFNVNMFVKNQQDVIQSNEKDTFAAHKASPVVRDGEVVHSRTLKPFLRFEVFSSLIIKTTLSQLLNSVE